jgi:glycosyltransferase involved in cell wall biosynthesis
MTTDPAPLIDIVIPVYNEQADLERSVRRLRAYLDDGFPFTARVTIADNASTDATWAIAERLATDIPGVATLHLPQKGRGRALRTAWLASDAQVVAYMDVDLSTDLDALLPLVAPLLSGHSDVAIGSRLMPGSRVVRGPKRELISRSYNLILRTTLRARFHDAQCGFKAMRTDVARRLLPTVRDNAWFFDTELLVLAERAGLRIHEVPVDWVDDPGSTVHIRSTATDDLKGVWRLLRDQWRGERPPSFSDIRAPRPRSTTWQQVKSFAVIGVLSTVAYVVLYALLRGTMSAALANATALLITAIGNTAANRRLTFGVRGSAGMARHQFGGLVAFAVALVITSASIGVLYAVSPHPARIVEVSVLVAANVLATVVRFLLLRQWIERPTSTAAAAPPPAASTVAERSDP